jgi:hypothetical protein
MGHTLTTHPASIGGVRIHLWSPCLYQAITTTLTVSLKGVPKLKRARRRFGVFDFTLTFSQSDIYPTGTGLAGVPTTSTVTVQTNPAAANLNVNLSVNEIVGSGGHLVHTGTRPLGTLNAVQGITGANGAFQTIYTSSMFGGGVTVTASVTNASVNKSSIMNVRVPGLASLGTGANHRLIGDNDFHPNNHFGTAAPLANLPLIADDYKSTYYGTGAIPFDDKIAFNDLSLINGGKFEVPGNWSQANTNHAEHRIGINCDVRYTNVPAARHATLEAIFQARGVASWLKHPTSSSDPAPPHYHVRF